MKHPLPIPLLLLALGCVERVEPPQNVPAVFPGAAWSNTIDRVVRDEGVDWAELQANRPVVDQMLAWIAEHGPETRRISEIREGERLADLLNAHNAIVVGAVLRFIWVGDGQPGLLPAPGERLRRRVSWRVDGEWITLDRLATHRILAIFQDPDVHAGLYRAARGGPPLRWFQPEDVSGKLGLAMGEWLNSDQGLRKTATGYAASEYFFTHERDFLDWGEAPNLCAWMVDNTVGERRAWLAAHVDTCPLERFPWDSALDQAR